MALHQGSRNGQLKAPLLNPKATGRTGDHQCDTLQLGPASKIDLTAVGCSDAYCPEAHVPMRMGYENALVIE